MDSPIASQKHCCKRNRLGSSLNDSSNICWDPLQCVTCGLRDGQERHNLSLHDRGPKPPGPKVFNYSCDEWIDHNLNVKLRLTLKEGTNLKSLFFFPNLQFGFTSWLQNLGSCLGVRLLKTCFVCQYMFVISYKLLLWGQGNSHLLSTDSVRRIGPILPNNPRCVSLCSSCKGENWGLERWNHLFQVSRLCPCHCT